MLTAEARVQTGQPGRYVTQFCRHARQVHRLRHQPPAHDGGAQPPEVRSAECSGTRAVVSFGWGQCTMVATPGTLTVRVEAADAEKLRLVQDIVARDVERFGKRERLTLDWQSQ
jgi:hypothetical protein